MVPFNSVVVYLPATCSHSGVMQTKMRVHANTPSPLWPLIPYIFGNLSFLSTCFWISGALSSIVKLQNLLTMTEIQKCS